MLVHLSSVTDPRCSDSPRRTRRATWSSPPRPCARPRPRWPWAAWLSLGFLRSGWSSGCSSIARAPPPPSKQSSEPAAPGLPIRRLLVGLVMCVCIDAGKATGQPAARVVVVHISHFLGRCPAAACWRAREMSERAPQPPTDTGRMIHADRPRRIWALASPRTPAPATPLTLTPLLSSSQTRRHDAAGGDRAHRGRRGLRPASSSSHRSRANGRRCLRVGYPAAPQQCGRRYVGVVEPAGTRLNAHGWANPFSTALNHRRRRRQAPDAGQEEDADGDLQGLRGHARRQCPFILYMLACM